MNLLIPLYEKEGKVRLNIALDARVAASFGCYGQ